MNDEGTEYVSDNPNYRCKTCGEKHYTAKRLNEHILEKHPEQRKEGEK